MTLATMTLLGNSASSFVIVSSKPDPEDVVNVGCGPAEERVLLTGLHAVADIYCENCKTTLGWKYEHAFESSQKYKEGKYIIELAHMIKDNGWD
ncbi:Protein yippee-like 2 [Tupaia chinensis]|uniref:Protein yippee-like n=1 Tax=Tupaia chinensis TaxID=246437 RepID=L9KG03_TUPCH|nr:Protein yippee-like 2 [Tupaia chinensis]